jgi:hypothetical protein
MGCASTRNVILGQLSPAFHEFTKVMENETDMNILSSSLPAQLKLAEGLLGVNPTDINILGALIQGYTAQGMAVFETQSLDDELAGRRQGNAWKTARLCYQRAIGFGERYLLKRGLTIKELQTALRDNNINELFTNELRRTDREPVFYLAQAIALAANLDKSHQRFVSYLPLSEAMMTWVCSPTPDFRAGLCPLFTAVALASRPRMLGGNAPKARELFIEAIKKYPDNLFIRTAYLQYSVIPRSGKTDWLVQKEWFEKEMAAGIKGVVHDTEDSAIPLLNAVALRRFEIISRHEKKLF